MGRGLATSPGKEIKNNYVVNCTITRSCSIQSKNTHSVWIVPRLCEKYTRREWPCLYSSGYTLEYIVPRLYQKYTCSEWAWLYGSGYTVNYIAPLFPISTRVPEYTCVPTGHLGHVANPRPVATIKTGWVRMLLWLVAPVDKKRRDTFSRPWICNLLYGPSRARAQTTVMSRYYANFYQR